MAHHHELTDRFRDGIFFAHPGSPWMRGSASVINVDSPVLVGFGPYGPADTNRPRQSAGTNRASQGRPGDEP
jgi:hypothetical protein